ncbi:MAG: hypothetical protein PHG69_06815 [Candidatus Omnitrophica bacterium]|nr:hypothetical protein [Candidatus Omnitrophota bacterium]
MIRINLLPANFKRQDDAAKGEPSQPLNLPTYQIMAVVFIAVLAIHVVLALMTFNKKMQIASLDRVSKRMHAQSKEVESIKKDITEKKDKLKVMESVLSKNLYTTQFLSKINKATPRGLWLNRLSFSERGLVMEGSVFSLRGEEVSLVNIFFDELKGDDFFVKNFVDFNIDSVQRKSIKQYEVLDFILTAEIKKEEKKVSDESVNKRKR